LRAGAAKGAEDRYYLDALSAATPRTVRAAIADAARAREAHA